MDVQIGSVFQLTSRLRSLSITEIVWGALALAMNIWNLITDGIDNGWNIFHVIVAALLLGTGIFGVLSIQRLRSNIQDVRSFRILGACNVVLCVIDSITLVILVVCVILLLFAPAAAHSMGILADEDDADADSRRSHIEKAMGTSELGTTPLIFYIIFLGVTAIYVALTAMAAVFSFRISARLSADNREVLASPAGIPLIGAAGYGSYPMANTHPPPMYTAEAPLKQNLGY